jgi:hypothetical protein
MIKNYYHPAEIKARKNKKGRFPLLPSRMGLSAGIGRDR